MIDFNLYREAEFLEPEKIAGLQKRLFKRHFGILAQSPYYKEVLANEKVDKIELHDLSRLPFTGKTDLSNRNDDFLAVPYSRISDIVCTSGTTGEPTKIMYTENDLGRLAFNEETAFRRCGVTGEDVVLLACTMDRCFIAGLAYFLGIRNIGAAAVRDGVNNFHRHQEIIRRLKPTVIVGVPSFLRKLALFIESQGSDPSETSVSKLVCIGEPVRERNFSPSKLGNELEELWEAKIFSTYASTEMVTTFCECGQQAGGHFHPALAVVEIIDNQERVLPSGETGEVVVTPLFVEGMPLLRFKTGDISFLTDEPCACGRHSPRLGPILGRKKQMIKYQGTTFYPQAVYRVLDNIPEIGEYYLEVTSDFDLSDKLTVHTYFEGQPASADTITDKLQASLRVTPKVVISSRKEIKKQVYPENSRKSIHFIDKRICTAIKVSTS